MPKKSACMYSSPCKRSSPEIGCRPTFYVRGQSAEYVNEWAHLANVSLLLVEVDVSITVFVLQSLW